MTKITPTNKSLSDTPKKYCRVILTEDKPSWHRLVEADDGHLEYRMGAGKRKKATPRSFRTLVRTIVQSAKAHQLEYIAIQVGPMGSPEIEEKGDTWFFRTLAENLQLAQYEFRKYKTEKRIEKELREILVCGIVSPVEKRSFSTGLTVGDTINTTRDIANTTGEHMTPSLLAKTAKDVMKGTGVTVKILDFTGIKKEKMGLLEAVGKGATDKPRLIVLEYWGRGKTKKGKEEAPIALIGKGITYDSGGLNVKPSGFMHDMHLDMSGGASVIGAMRAIAKLGVKKNVIAVIATAENSISGDSMRAGDIATSMSGKTVEILHTDAEGRMVLADAMTYAEKYYSPRVILDIATLTGASIVALGQHASAVLTKDVELQEKLVALGEDTGDLAWPLPLWCEYKTMLKSHRADISNIDVNFSRYAGCIEGGIFLSFFAPKKKPWAHIDIAPRMSSIPHDKLAKGATGEPVRLLIKFVEEY
ncbi:leucyl aminopeptidase family protein [Candidatus Kaiserbacteria bacterium]|nr:leucyl aminopeptidase family protein [Candidatus Kaiserbacteria bacterium]USN92033.1 MAG: leucyl aminopeptidase family protein [Candidatus Nomurabacteria bacterium]